MWQILQVSTNLSQLFVVQSFAWLLLFDIKLLSYLTFRCQCWIRQSPLNFLRTLLVRSILWCFHAVAGQIKGHIWPWVWHTCWRLLTIKRRKCTFMTALLWCFLSNFCPSASVQPKGCWMWRWALGSLPFCTVMA